MKKNDDLLKWLLPLGFGVFLALGSFAYTSGTKFENHGQRISVLEKNGKLLIKIGEKIDSLLKK